VENADLNGLATAATGRSLAGIVVVVIATSGGNACQRWRNRQRGACLQNPPSRKPATQPTQFLIVFVHEV
jgi:hypothetical protein